jgi:hypothetical protein
VTSTLRQSAIEFRRFSQQQQKQQQQQQQNANYYTTKKHGLIEI